MRALEVYKIAKRPISELHKERRGILKDRRFHIRVFGLTLPRNKLYHNINERVEDMFSKGIVREVRGLLKHRCSKTLKQALGIKEVSSYLKGEINLEEAKRLLKRNTRRYAKRQISWFGKNLKIRWLDADNLAKAAKEVAAAVIN